MNTNKHKIYQKVLSSFTALLLLFQSVVPTVAYAQEATESAAIETTTPIEESIVQAEPSEGPIVTPSPSPDADLSSSTPSAVVEVPQPTATPAVEDQNSAQSNEITEGQPNAPPVSEQTSNDSSPTPSPSEQPVLETVTHIGQLSTYIIENTDAQSLELDLSTQNDITSASLTTDKADYAPTDTAVITGSGFPKEVELRLIITADNYRYEDGVQTSANGSFTYFYQLDGTYRPLYNVAVEDLSGNVLATTSFTDSPGNLSANLDQCRNGAATSPNDCLALGGSQGWANGNAGETQSHYVEGYSVPYRVVMTGLPTSTTITVDIGYDIKHGGVYAIDYITHYDRLEPHDLFGHPAENIDPLSGVVGVSATSTTYPIPAPSSAGSPVVGQPTTSFNSLPASERVMTLFGGTISNVDYVSQGVLVDGNSETVVRITFTVDSPTAVLAWGGHIASEDDWGQGNSAGAISGSPYHTRLKDWNLNNLGNQDRSLSASAVVIPGTITIIKEADPQGPQQFNYTGDLGNFSLVDNGTTANTHPSGDLTTFGTYNVSEVVPAGWSLDNIICVDPDSQTAVDIGNGTVSIDLDEGEDITCTFYNSIIPGTVVVHKDVQGPLGQDVLDTSQNFTVRLDGVDPQTFTDGGSVTYNNVVPGDHTITEDTPPQGYDLFSITPDADSGTTGAQINVPAGGTVDVFVVNRQKSSSLTLLKTVVNDNGGTAVADDFQAYINGSPVDWNSAQTLPAGNYTASEAVVSGYTPSVWGGDCSADGSVSLALGEHKTCSITNDDQPGTLIVKKVLINDNGGSSDVDDFGFQVNGGSLTPFESDGQNDLTQDAGTYTVTEPQVAGYDTTYNNCTNVVIPNGGSETCTITNDDQPAHIVVIKHVVNNSGGNNVASDFTMHINGTAVGAGVSFPGAEAPGVDTEVNVGTFEVSEDAVVGYESSLSGECSGTIANGETKVCTITNDDKISEITLIKIVSNSFGGDAISDDFNLTIDGNVVLSGSTTEVIANQAHTIDETEITGYTFVSITGDDKCPNALGGSVTLNEGEHITCIITNQDVAPTITLIKNVINDDGGNALPDDFDLTIDGSVVLSGATTVVFSNILIALSETLLTGYNFISITGDIKCPDVLGGTVILDEGENITCTITNDDIAPQLKLVKNVTNNNGGVAVSGEWTLSAEGEGGFSDAGDSDTFHEVLANEIYTLSEDGPSGYTASDWDCDGGELEDDQLTLDLAEVVTCTIENDDNIPSLTLIKHVQNNNGGTAAATDWTLEASGPTPISGSGGAVSDDSFNAGTYTLSESGPEGYTASDWSCSGGTQNGDQITLGLGESATCEITNDDNGPSLTLVKHVINDNGGSAQASDWTLTASGPTPISGSGEATSDATFQAGAYTLSESGGPSGYSASEWSCSGGVQNGNQITIGLGDQVSCEITNDDISPQLTVIKHVINDNGGQLDAANFTMIVLGDNVSPALFAGSESGTTVTLDEGAYSVGEIEQDGYTMTTVGDCQGQILVGESKTCTIINDDQAATLIVRKVVINDNGGTGNPEDFSFQVNGESAKSFEADGENELTVDAGTYTVTEPEVSGYTTTYDNCEDVVIPNGGSATCTITNDDNAPSLTLVKEVINDNGGQQHPSAWILTAAGPTGISGNGPSVSSDLSFDSGTYDLSESGPSGYSASDWSCVGGSQTDGDTVVIGLGDQVTCIITNDDIAPRLKLVKEVEGGNAVPSDWTLTAEGIGGFSDLGDSDTFHQVLANETYTLSEEGPSGYTASDWDCGEANLEGDQLTLSLDEEVTCTITNTRDSGTITVIKDVVPDDESLWDMVISGEVSQSETIADGGQTGPHTLPTGPYTITEAGSNDYVSSFLCLANEEQEITSGQGRIIELELSKDQNIVCTFTNQFVPPQLTLTKTNNRLGQDVPPGSDVLYTLTVELSGAGLTDVNLTDVLPNGFIYRSESWTASSSVRGDLKALGVTPEPGYASPGIWLLGDMINGEVVTLSLIADIKGDIDLGLYKDLAWSVGTSSTDDEVLANEDSGVFVGTEVNVVKGPAGENYQVERTEERISEVLGAAIELPATGADIRWIGLATALFVLGSSMTIAGLMLRRKYES